MKKIIISMLLVMLITLTGCSKKEIKDDIKNVIENVSLLEFDKYKDIKLDDIDYIDYSRYTEAGRDDEKITDQDEIKSIYNSLKSLKLVKETTRACDDNTKVYSFHMKDGKTIEVEIECDWLVHGNKRYEIK